MKNLINQELKCEYPCTDINKGMLYPQSVIDTKQIRLVMISEAPPKNSSDYFYKSNSGTFFQTTQAVFQDAGIQIKSYEDLTQLGIYLSTAIKCCKKDYLVSSKTIKFCSKILESELSQFPEIKVIMCMGDFAIKAINYIYKDKYGIAPIKSGSTYKIRKEIYQLKAIRFFPSYTHTGDSFNIEKSKRRMIAEDIKNALAYLNEYSKK